MTATPSALDEILADCDLAVRNGRHEIDARNLMNASAELAALKAERDAWKNRAETLREVCAAQDEWKLENAALRSECERVKARAERLEALVTEARDIIDAAGSKSIELGATEPVIRRSGYRTKKEYDWLRRYDEARSALTSGQAREEGEG